MNQPSKTDVQGRADRVNDIQQVHVSVAQDQVLSLLPDQQQITENSYQNLSGKYQCFFDIHCAQLLQAMNVYACVLPKAALV